nr:MAG TPA: hypothetical protein [Crassvirales sp.]
MTHIIHLISTKKEVLNKHFLSLLHNLFTILTLLLS